MKNYTSVSWYDWYLLRAVFMGITMLYRYTNYKLLQCHSDPCKYVLYEHSELVTIRGVDSKLPKYQP